MRGGAGLMVVALLLCALAAGCAGSDPVERPGRPSLAEDVAAHLESAGELDPVRALVVLHDGETVLEEYYDSTAADFHDTESVTKSILATLVGIAVDDGTIESVDDSLAELLPSYAEKMSPAVARTTLREVLTMTGGFSDRLEDGQPTFLTADDPVATILADGRGPGRFRYTNAGAHLVAAVLAEASGTSVLDFAQERLFAPLGIDTGPALEPLMDPAAVPDYERADFAWPVDRAGLHSGFGFVKLRARDLAALGQLHLDEGEWRGSPVVSADWVRAATSAQTPVDGPTSYGYLWWVDEVDGQPAYRAQGTGGQVIRVVPSLDLVVVVQSEFHLGDPDAPEVDPNAVLFLTDDVIAPHFAG